jgi:alpha-galactosidase
MRTKSILPIIMLLKVGFLFAQPFATWDKQSLTLDNGVVKRVLQFNKNNNGIVSSSLNLKNGKDDFLSPNSEEFYFEINGKSFTGLDTWNLVSIENTSGDNKGNGAVVVLQRSDPDIKISITYLLYPGSPVIRKKIAFLNTGKKELKLEALDIEYLRFLYSGTGTHCWVMNDYARQKSLGQFIGNWYDPVVVVHDITHHRGIVLGSVPLLFLNPICLLQGSHMQTRISDSGNGSNPENHGKAPGFSLAYMLIRMILMPH